MVTDPYLYYDDVEVGQEWETFARTITEADIVNFAGLSGDFNAIHTDHEFAKTTPYRKPIAHGLLIFSIGSGLSVTIPMLKIVAFTKVCVWNFLGPCYIGDTIRMRSKITEKKMTGRGKRGEIIWYRAIMNQHGKVIQDGSIQTMVQTRLGKASEDKLIASRAEKVASDGE
jgi:3-hydroxybutyryl-CoA dehydratase